MYSVEKRFTRGAIYSLNVRIKKYCPATPREIIYKLIITSLKIEIKSPHYFKNPTFHLKQFPQIIKFYNSHYVTWLKHVMRYKSVILCIKSYIMLQE